MSYFDIVRKRRRAPLIQSLRTSLARLKEREGLRPDDPVLLELQRSLVRTMTELELRQQSGSEAAQDPADSNCPPPGQCVTAAPEGNPGRRGSRKANSRA